MSITVTIKNDEQTHRLILTRKVEDKAEKESVIQAGQSQVVTFVPGRDLSVFSIELEKI